MDSGGIRLIKSLLLGNSCFINKDWIGLVLSDVSNETTTAATATVEAEELLLSLTADTEASTNNHESICDNLELVKDGSGNNPPPPSTVQSLPNNDDKSEADDQPNHSDSKAGLTADATPVKQQGEQEEEVKLATANGGSTVTPISLGNISIF